MNREKAVSIVQLCDSIFQKHLESILLISEENQFLIARRESELENELQDALDSATQIKMPEIRGEWFEEYDRYKYHFDYLVIHSLFLTSFSLFEDTLKVIAEVYQDLSENSIRINDINGNSNIDQYRKYLHLIAEIESANSDYVEWREVNDFKAIRNAIVHNGSILNPGEKKHKNVRGFNKLKEHNIWYRLDTLHFKIKKISFLRDYSTHAKNYIDNICEDLISKIQPAS